MNVALFLSALLAVTPIEDPPTQSTAVSATSDTLFESVTDTWKGCSFACDYEVVSGSIQSNERFFGQDPEMLPFEKVDLSLPPVEMYELAFRHKPGRGRLCKRVDLVFVSDFPSAVPTMTTTLTSSNAGESARPAMINMYVEGMANRDMQIQYYHNGQRTNVGRAGLTKRDPDNDCGFPDPMISPISPQQSCEGYGRYYFSTDPPLRELITDLGNSRLLVERVWERKVDDYSLRCYSLVTFDNSYARPVIEEINQRAHKIASDGTDADLQTFDRVALLNHVDCGGEVHLAKRVIRARMSNVNRPQILITEWKSANLGERPPRDSDFVIEVKGNDDTIGFKNAQQRVFTFADLDMNKKQQPGGIVWGPKGDPSQPPPGPPKALVPRPWWLSRLIWANLIGLPLLAIYLVRRLRRTKMPHP